MNASMVTTLAGHIATVVEDGILVTSVTMGEMADGSRRSYALVHVQGVDDVEGNDVTYRITSPAPDNAPAWAKVHTLFTVEIDTGDFWEEIETFEVQHPGDMRSADGSLIGRKDMSDAEFLAPLTKETR